MKRTLKINAAVILAVVVLMVLGTIMIYSASAVKAGRDFGDGGFFFKRQALFGVAALSVMIAMSLIPYGAWERLAAPLIILTIVLLAAVLSPLGHTSNNATRWFRIGPVSLQVAEFAKLVVVIYLARYLGRRSEEVGSDSRILIRPLVLLVTVVVLVACEPDLGTAIFIGLLGCGMFFVAGAPLRSLAGLAIASSPLIAFLILKQEFRVQRIQAFLNPWKEYEGSGFQLVQSFLAFGDGGVFGTGLGGGKSKLLFLPESHTDFILAVVGEELGFVGVAVVIGLYGVIVTKGIQIARRAPDSFGMLTAAGVTLMIGLQALINAMVVLGLLPTKGLPLPFFSYGGSSLLTSAAAAGILMSVSTRGSEP
ncbi:MAG: putative lipid II flippase FtsW [bacterium]|nr:MAG: putative lipid II flippase FtsW [bacterium]